MDSLKIVKVEKEVNGEKKVYNNIYLFGVAIKCVNSKDYAKLYYLVKGYLNK